MKFDDIIIEDKIKEKAVILAKGSQNGVFAEEALKTGGFLVVYVPNLTQVKPFLDAVRRSRIKVLETVELLERTWKIEDKIMRPEFEMLGHTGFLTFCRKF